MPSVSRSCPKDGSSKGHSLGCSIAVLNVGGMNDNVQQETQRVDQDVPLATFDLLARVVARRIEPSPPFAARNFSITRIAFSRDANMSSLAWIALSSVASAPRERTRRRSRQAPGRCPPDLSASDGGP
jgi:hypothetical protein